MFSVFSKKDIAVDLDKFESGKFNKLLIIGVGGAGKTVASKYFADKYDIPYYTTDQFIRENTDLRYDDYDKYKIQQYEFIQELINSNEKSIIEGAILQKIELRDQMLKYPIIILGTSGFKGALRAGLRKLQKGLGIGFLDTFKQNWSKRSERTETFRKERLEVPNTKVEEIFIPYIERRKRY